MLSSIPQGTVLGPLLFLVFTSDMVIRIEKKMVQYVDDAMLVIVIKSAQMRDHVALSLNHNLKEILEWCNCCGWN